ncbi:ORF009 [Spodoptera frugiperda granulovirus]|uniref:DUF884 n=1 Tax=Spodoptera frugiperda granulovirus TaxID=307454 RepID=A0A068FN25_9BBAC|nr:ORF009 [Spodoptera frugiperda granulovirus]AID68446.1 DUF884 [Spodoptera frugiperda granulovirus]AJK91670.1 ORF009 [Spodoptera frugiperda granulovirus]
MLTLGKCSSCDSESITFQIAYGYDACLQFKYAITDKQVNMSRAVSGIDSTRPLTFNIYPMSKEITASPIKNSYVISLFRLPYIYPHLLKVLNGAVCVVKVFSSSDGPELWYVMGVRKEFETVKTRAISAVVTNQGKFEKEVYVITGNLPREFVAALRVNRAKNVHYLHSLTTNLPRVLVNNGPVRLDRHA